MKNLDKAEGKEAEEKTSRAEKERNAEEKRSRGEKERNAAEKRSRGEKERTGIRGERPEGLTSEPPTSDL